jgi:hypothetical protein
MNDWTEDDRRRFLRALAARLQNSAEFLERAASEAGRPESSVQAEPDGAQEQQRLREEIEAGSFTYLEYLEFGSAEEFCRFRNQPAISAEEIARVDWDELLQQLLARN